MSSGPGLTVSNKKVKKDWPIKTVVLSWRPTKFGDGSRWSLAWWWHIRRCPDCQRIKYTWPELKIFVARKTESGRWAVTSKPAKGWHGEKPSRAEYGPRIECGCFGKRGPRKLQVLSSLADLSSVESYK